MGLVAGGGKLTEEETEWKEEINQRKKECLGLLGLLSQTATHRGLNDRFIVSQF